MIQAHDEFGRAALEAYERTLAQGDGLRNVGVSVTIRGATCGILQGFVANLARATSRECAHEALRHAMADFGGNRQERPARESVGFIVAIWISGAALGATLAGIVAVLAR